MPIAQSARVHATAVIDPEAEVGEDVQVGPFVVIEGPVKVGPGCVLKNGAHLIGPMTLGCRNTVHSFAVLGDIPQHLGYGGEQTRLEIGDHNIFREHVTVHRATSHTSVTRIGNHNFFMAGSHVAHDCVVGNRCLFANGALLAGHCIVGDNVFLSGNSAVHQFVRIGRLALLSGCSTTSKDIPPFVMQNDYNTVVGVNIVGMRRAGLTAEQINGVRRAFNILFRESLPLPEALAQAEAEEGSIDTVQELLEFVKSSSRGVSLSRSRRHNEAA